MKIRLSIKQNLLVEITIDKNLNMVHGVIQSYETVVGYIKDGKVVENGKYSRTTSKHMSFILAITELPVVSSKEKRYFGWLWDGVKIAHEDSISSASSISILKDLSKGKSFFEAVASLDIIKKKDYRIIEEVIEDKDLKLALENYRSIKNSFALV
jgi:hypothetical protein